MTLDDAVAAGKVRRGDLVALCASGGGLSMAASLYRWTA
jgi:3-oxoacyl-[acyl-carrier-protein] synthase-3